MKNIGIILLILATILLSSCSGSSYRGIDNVYISNGSTLTLITRCTSEEPANAPGGGVVRCVAIRQYSSTKSEINFDLLEPLFRPGFGNLNDPYNRDNAIYALDGGKIKKVSLVYVIYGGVTRYRLLYNGEISIKVLSAEEINDLPKDLRSLGDGYGGIYIMKE